MSNFKHGFYRDYPEYAIWKLMLGRCNPEISGDSSQWMDYGGRGITVCEEWKNERGFLNFIEHIGRRPKGLLLDRIDNDGNYEPGNVRWATREDQNRNTRKQKGKNPEDYCIVKVRKRFRVIIRLNYQKKHIGMYSTIEEARSARDQAYQRFKPSK